MDDEMKAKFRAFASRFGGDDAVLDTGLKGVDLHRIADMIESVVEIQEIDLGSLGGFANLRPLRGMDWLAEPR